MNNDNTESFAISIDAECLNQDFDDIDLYGEKLVEDDIDGFGDEIDFE